MKQFIFLGALTFATPLWAGLIQTDSHTYIVSERDNAVLSIDRKTGEEKIIKVGSGPREMKIHNNMGYVLNWGSNTVSVLDLYRQEVVKEITFKANINKIVLRGSFGYVTSFLSDTISVIELETLKVINSIPTGSGPIDIKADRDFGYVVIECSRSVSIVDLYYNKVIKTILVGKRPKSIVIHGGMGYVVNNISNDVSVIDLNSNSVIQTIPVGYDPQTMLIHGDVGYVLNVASDNVSVIDLKRQVVSEEIPCGTSCESMNIIENCLYLAGNYSVSVIDLKMKKVVHMFDNPKDASMGFSDTHVYLGLEKVCPHFKPIYLFDSPYEGIQYFEIFPEGGEEAFRAFEKLMDKGDERAKEQLEIALAVGNPKAYAVAAFAFLHGKWGAKDTPLMLWYSEFRQDMDRGYFKSIAFKKWSYLKPDLETENSRKNSKKSAYLNMITSNYSMYVWVSLFWILFIEMSKGDVNSIHL